MSYAVSITRDHSYGDDERHAFDLYRPDTPSPPPAVVYFHGGGFSQGDKAAPESETRVTALAEYGVAVVAANYRLAPAATYPAPILDAKSVVADLRARGHELNLDVRKVGAWGASAGGYLAAMVGLTADDPDLGSEDLTDCHVDAVVEWFAPVDLRASSSRSQVENLVLGKGPECAMLGIDDPSAGPALVDEASPVNRARPRSPPFLISHGDRDLFVSIHQSAMLHDALVRVGADSTFITLGGVGHESHRFDQPDHLAITAAFLLSHLG